jgi:hypothetical protein
MIGERRTGHRMHSHAVSCMVIAWG